jgi:hypothetical protein
LTHLQSKPKAVDIFFYIKRSVYQEADHKIKVHASEQPGNREEKETKPLGKVASQKSQ